MPSPFPGMDPYLEAPDLWRDFHANLAMEIQTQLAPRLRPKYIAALEPRVEMNEIFVQSTPKVIFPDVAVVNVSGRGGLAAVAIPPAPLVGEMLLEEYKGYAVEVRLAGIGKLVTAIEILSPTNKRPNSRALEAYRQKRVDLRRAEVSLLEIDLLRAGERMQIHGALPEAPYFVFLSRGGMRLEIWPITLLDPLPVVPVPLEYPDADVALDLGQAIRAIYDRAAYDLRIDYSKLPSDPETLTAEEVLWVRERVHTMPSEPPV